MKRNKLGKLFISVMALMSMTSCHDYLDNTRRMLFGANRHRHNCLLTVRIILSKIFWSETTTGMTIPSLMRKKPTL